MERVRRMDQFLDDFNLSEEHNSQDAKPRFSEASFGHIDESSANQNIKTITDDLINLQKQEQNFDQEVKIPAT